METGNHRPCTTSSFLPLFSRGQGERGLINLEIWPTWPGGSSPCLPPTHCLPPECMQLGLDPWQNSEDVIWERFCAQVESWLCMVWPENYGAKSPLHRCALLETYQDCSNSSCNVWIGPVPFDVATAMIENLISEQGAKEAIVAMTWDCRVLKSEVRFLPFEQVSDGRL